jgi:phage terminase large subunit GpA-like protein
MPTLRKPKAVETGLTVAATRLRNRLFAGFRAPPLIVLAEWAEQNIILPEGQSARPGKYRNWPYFRDIINDIGDPTVEYVDLIKPTRVGFTKGLTVAIGSAAANNPCPMILLVPTDQDARDYSVDEIEPVFEHSPALMKLILPSRPGRPEGGRNTLLRKSFLGGGSLKILPARAPRNLRRHDAKLLFIDEADAMELTAEGDPILLAERRTMAHADRKIVVGSTPTEEDISAIDRRYKESDQRVYEVPCPHCGGYFEILFQHIRWPPDEPELAYCLCPHCSTPIDEKHKGPMVEAGLWRATRPEIEHRHGYRLNAFVSLLANAAWGKLAREWLSAKRGGPAEMQVFVNTVEARVWRTSIGSLTADTVAARVESFGIDSVPPEVLALTAGADVQDDRIEVTVLGWPMPPKVTGATGRAATGVPYVLHHEIVVGNTLDDGTWAAFERWRKGVRVKHPNGWTMTLDAVAIDSGNRTQKVYDYCTPRLHQRVFAVKGLPGARAIWQRGAKTAAGHVHFNVAVDVVKAIVLEALGQPAFLDTAGETDPLRNPHSMRLSASLDAEWFEQATGETRRIRYIRNRTVVEYQPKRAGQRVEALDCLVYATAARHAPQMLTISFVERSTRQGERQVRSMADWSKALNA